MTLDLVHVDPPKMPDENWFTDWGLDIISGGDESLRELLKPLCQ